MKKGQRFTKWNNKFNVNEILNLIENGYNIKKISNIIGIPEKRLSEMFKYYNIYNQNTGQTISKNHNFFENIDSEIKAYLLGYTIADGCVSIEPKRKNDKIYSYSKRLTYTVSINDREIINLLQQYISPQSKIKEFHNSKGALIRKNQLTIRFASSKLVDDIIKLNVIPNKTYHSDFKFPFEKINNEYIKDLIRGFMDGDGCVEKNSIQFVSTSKIFLEQIIEFFKKEIPEITHRITENKGKTINYFKLYLTGGKIMKQKVYNLLYKNANYYLSRKKNKFNIENTVLTNQITKG